MLPDSVFEFLKKSFLWRKMGVPKIKECKKCYQKIKLV